MEAGGDDRNESVSTAFDFSACTTAETVSLIHATGLAVQQISVIISSQKKKKKKVFAILTFAKKEICFPRASKLSNPIFFADNSTTRSSREGDVSWVRWKPERKMSATGKETAAKS